MFEDIHVPNNLLVKGMQLPKSIARQLPGLDPSDVLTRYYARHRTLRSLPKQIRNITGLYIELNGEESAMHINAINLNYEELCRRGIGTHLLRSAIDFGRHPRHSFTKLTADWASLALLRTTIGLVEDGDLDDIVVTHRGTRYGEGQEKPLPEIVVDVPPKPGQPYAVEHFEATIAA